MKNVLPDYNVNIALRTAKISQLFSRSAKPLHLFMYKTPECIYNLECVCKEDYIGMSLRPLHHRIHEHGQPSIGGKVLLHKTHCKAYKKTVQRKKEIILINILNPHKNTFAVSL